MMSPILAKRESEEVSQEFRKLYWILKKGKNKTFLNFEWNSKVLGAAFFLFQAINGESNCRPLMKASVVLPIVSTGESEE